MQVSALRLIATLALLLNGCVGVVGESQSDYQSPAQGSPRNARDGGRDARSDIGGGSDDGDDLQVDIGSATSPDGGFAEASAIENLCPKTRQKPLALGLRIREIALYQTVKVPLFSDGAWVATRTSPIVQGKKSLVRVFVDTLANYQPHAVRGVLQLNNGGQITEVVDQRTQNGASTDTALSSTFSFQVDGSLITGNTELSVALEELACGSAMGAVQDTLFPPTGSQPLEAVSVAKLEVVVVPVKVDGRVPVTTEAELATMRSALLAYYPVPDVEVSVRTPLNWTNPVSALDGQSWSNLLTQIVRERRTDAPSANVYYFGLVQPAATFRAYCQRGCVLGLAPQTTSVMPTAQVALGASFGDQQTYETMVHEIGHAHGRGHAPCVDNGEIDGVDSKYPDPMGNTVSWGWDSRSNMLMPPTYKDIMGYCEPNWISAYNYNGLAERSLQVNHKALIVGASGVRWQHVLLYADHSARWGGMVETRMPSGQVELAQALDAQGHALEEVEVVRIPLSHTGDQYLYIPEPQPGWAALQLSDQKLVLAAIQPRSERGRVGGRPGSGPLVVYVDRTTSPGDRLALRRLQNRQQSVVARPGALALGLEDGGDLGSTAAATGTGFASSAHVANIVCARSGTAPDLSV